MHDERLQIWAESAEGRLLVSVVGMVDSGTADLLRDRLLQAAGKVPVPHLVVDLERAEFGDSAGLSALVSAWQAVRDRAGSLVLARAPESLEQLMRRTGLDQHIAGSRRTGNEV